MYFENNLEYNSKEERMKKNPNRAIIESAEKENLDASSIELDSVDLNENQVKRLEGLNKHQAYGFATYSKSLDQIYFTKIEYYEAFLNYLRAVAAIVPDLDCNVEVTDITDDSYWIVVLKGGKIQECFGTVIWDSLEDRRRVREVLDAHLDTTPEHLTTIVDQVMRAIKGEFDEKE
jgi:hypothetical protein